MDNIETEAKVLEAAREVFQRKGYSGARMDDIANEAGVNKALVHYYFRSKEKLFDKVFKEALAQFIQRVVKILNSDLPLDVKIYKTVDMYSSMLQHNRQLPIFVLGELSENPERMIEMVKGQDVEIFKNLALQLKEEYRKGNIIEIPVYEFFVNLISLTIFPFLIKPILHGVFDLEEEKFDKMVNNRRKSIPKMIIEMLRPR